MEVLSSLRISASALRAEKARMDVISSNLANIESTRTPDGGPYRKKEVVFQASPQGSFGQALKDAGGVRVSEIRESSAPFKRVYRPEHPDAGPEGFVMMPNVNLMEEMADLTSAKRAYEANITALKASKRMALKALEIAR